MATLKQMLKNEMDKDETFATVISKVAGYAKPSGFYKFLNNPESEFKDFNKLLNIVKTAFPEKEFEVMDVYIRSLKPNNMMARQALEYSNINRIYDLFEYLLSELKNSDNVSSQEWAEVYGIHNDIRYNRIEHMDAIDTVNKLVLKSMEMIVFSNIMKFYYYKELGYVGMMTETSYLIKSNLENLKDGFIKDTYQGRYGSIMADVHLHNGEIDKIKDVVEDTLEKVSSKNLLTVLYHQVGKGLIFTSYEKSKTYLNKALAVSNDINKIQISKSLNLLNSFWGTKEDFIDIEDEYNSKLADYGFSRIQFDKKEAVEILEKVNTSGFSDIGLGIYYMYLGKAKDDLDILKTSIKYFIKSKDKFYKIATLIELEKRGVDKLLLEALSI